MSGGRDARPRTVHVHDRMQHGYRYKLIEPAGEHFDAAFRPELTPKEMLEFGVFGGKYMTDCQAEFPADWYETAKLSPKRRDPSLNFFGVDASKPLAYWREKGWIYEEDPRGWFQWYCRYYMGRRCPDDARQIRRWSATSPRSGRTAGPATSIAALASGRRSFTGRTTAGGSSGRSDAGLRQGAVRPFPESRTETSSCGNGSK